MPSFPRRIKRRSQSRCVPEKVNFTLEDAESHGGLQARKYAKLMKASLIYCSSKESVNVQKIFKIVLAKCFDLNCNLAKISNHNEPILEF
jgi:hypothetical protein